MSSRRGHSGVMTDLVLNRGTAPVEHVLHDRAYGYVLREVLYRIPQDGALD